jgi:hypothetical protein
VTARDRWFGATGRKVPAVVLEGTADLTGAIELGDVSDLEALRVAHEAGTPVVVRASTIDEVTAALARPEVACVLVTDIELLSIDLADHTYG